MTHSEFTDRFPRLFHFPASRRVVETLSLGLLSPTFALLLRDLPSRGRQGSFDPVGLHYKI